jgi:magnesium transporter
VIVDCAVYLDGSRKEGTLDLEEAFEAGREEGAFVWIGVVEPDESEFDAVAKEFMLHPLAVEDAIHAHQRPKLEIYGESLFVVVKTASYNEAAEEISFSEILLFIGDGFVVTVRHGDASELALVRRELESKPKLLGCGPLAVLHAVLDRVVDDYEPVLDAIDADLNEIEAQVFSPERANPAERIYRLKREVLDMYRNTEPLLEPLGRLAAGKVPYTHPELANYFRDVEDHLRREVARIENMRDLLSDALQVNLAHISVRQNDDMRKISAGAAIIAVPTMLAGIWGMNFRHMPELDTWWGYPFALATIAFACFAVYRQAKRAGWL